MKQFIGQVFKHFIAQIICSRCCAFSVFLWPILVVTTRNKKLNWNFMERLTNYRAVIPGTGFVMMR